MVSPGAATDGVTYFFLKKTDDFFRHRPLQTDDLFYLPSRHSPLPPSDIVCPVFFLNLAAKNNFIRVSPLPLDGITRSGPLPPQ